MQFFVDSHWLDQITQFLQKKLKRILIFHTQEDTFYMLNIQSLSHRSLRRLRADSRLHNKHDDILTTWKKLKKYLLNQSISETMEDRRQHDSFTPTTPMSPSEIAALVGVSLNLQ